MFTNLVMMLATQAMMAMGKLANPVTGKVERQMQGAQIMIDMLEMLREKTRGNLSPEESRVLENTLRDLRLNYVAEANRGVNPASPGASMATPPSIDNGGIPDNLA